MKYTVKTALGGMCIGLSAALMMLSSVIPFLTYAIPAMAALLVLFIRVECDWKWALGVYVGTSAVSALVVPEKEAVAIYIALIGYYPLIKVLLDKLPKVIGYIVKALFFTGVIIATYYIIMHVFGISTELLEDTQGFMIPLLIVLGLAAFIMYDVAIEKLELAYYRRWQKKFRKLFKKH